MVERDERDRRLPRDHHVGYEIDGRCNGWYDVRVDLRGRVGDHRCKDGEFRGAAGDLGPDHAIVLDLRVFRSLSPDGCVGELHYLDRDRVGSGDLRSVHDVYAEMSTILFFDKI